MKNTANAGDDLRFLDAAMRDIDGWFSPEEGLAFYRIAKQCTGKGVAVEIGSWHGKSTVCIAKGAQAANNGLHIYAIDPHVGSEEHQVDGKVWTFEAFKKNVADFGVAELITPLVKFSHDAVEDVNEPVEFLFIDGAHDYDNVKIDFEDWFPKVMVGGIIAFHDSHWPGVRAVLGELAYSNPQLRRARRVMGTTLFDKVESTNWLDKVQKKLAWWRFILPIRFKRFRRRLLGREQSEQL